VHLRRGPERRLGEACLFAEPLRGPGIHEIIDRPLIHTLFPPLLHLVASEVVGFEALWRGPGRCPRVASIPVRAVGGSPH
jgi:hypothetical protein